VCVCVRVCVYICVCEYASLRVVRGEQEKGGACVLYIYMCVYVYVFSFIYIYVYMCVCVCVCVFIYIYISMCVCAHRRDGGRQTLPGVPRDHREEPRLQAHDLSVVQVSRERVWWCVW
jgi:hypothetical protein